MNVVRHTLRLQLKSIDGIQVVDSRRQEGSSLYKLNKISAIVSFTRNKKTKSTGSSLPLQPAGTVEMCRHPNGSFRYKVFWDCDLKDEHTVVFETNLHRSKKNVLQQQRLFLEAAGASSSKDVYESKTFQIIIGLKRADEFIVFAVSALSIHGPVDSMDLSLPLRDYAVTGSSPPIHYDKPQVYFKQDPGRKFSLAEDACLNLTVSVHNINKDVVYASSHNRGNYVGSMPSRGVGFVPHEHRVQSVRVLPIERNNMDLQPQIRAYDSHRGFPNENVTRHVDERGNFIMGQRTMSAPLIFQRDIVQEEDLEMHIVDKNHGFPSFPPFDPNGRLVERSNL